MVVSISDAAKASIISPAQGAQQECMSSFFSPLILVNETFKREAWEVLKQLQQCLK
jgi:hypothetical protein